MSPELDPDAPHYFRPCLVGPGHGTHCGVLIGNATSGYSECALPPTDKRHIPQPEPAKESEVERLREGLLSDVDDIAAMGDVRPHISAKVDALIAAVRREAIIEIHAKHPQPEICSWCREAGR